jgi:hypothetical protein
LKLAEAAGLTAVVAYENILYFAGGKIIPFGAVKPFGIFEHKFFAVSLQKAAFIPVKDNVTFGTGKEALQKYQDVGFVLNRYIVDLHNIHLSKKTPEGFCHPELQLKLLSA